MQLIGVYQSGRPCALTSGIFAAVASIVCSCIPFAIQLPIAPPKLSLLNAPGVSLRGSSEMKEESLLVFLSFLAMIVIVSGDSLYFGSSVRAPNKIKIKNIPQGSVRQYMDLCAKEGMGMHVHGGGCSEINALELYWTFNGQTDPPRTPSKPRIAPWVLKRGQEIGNEINAKPCIAEAYSGAGYGCHEIVFRRYGMEAVSGMKPDPEGQDLWAFDIVVQGYPREPCPG